MGLPAKSKNNSADMSLAQQDMGKADTLRYNVSMYVVEEKYDRAIEELRSFMEGKTEFPKFKDRVVRYVDHSVDLINAIRAKRKFPGAASLTMAKQQELKARFHDHFTELQQVLKSIDKIHTDLRIEDIRSTVWVIRALINSVFILVGISFLIEISHGLAASVLQMIDETFMWIVNVIANVIGF